MKKIITVLLFLVTCVDLQAQLGLPQWPIVTGHVDQAFNSSTATVQNNVITWSNNPASTLVTSINNPNAVSKKSSVSQAAMDPCGNMVFYIVHNGIWVAANTPRLNTFLANGTQVTFSSAAVMNANGGDDEIQVVRRPGVSNQWFVIYNQHVNNTSGTIYNPGYMAGNILYSLVEINGASGKYVLDGNGQEIVNRPLLVNGQAFNYALGKATSLFLTTVGGQTINGHFLYTQRRNQGSATVTLDRFIIDGSTAITFQSFSALINDAWWGADWFNPILGSPIEISPNGDVALLVRNTNDNAGNVYIYRGVNSTLDLSTIVPETVKFSDLALVPDPGHTSAGMYGPGITSPSQYLTVNEVGVGNGSGTTNYIAPSSPDNNGVIQTRNLNFLRYMEQRISGIEWSPSGQYLYFVGGGVVGGTVGNVTYVGQIDLNNTRTRNGFTNYLVRLQVETRNNGNYTIATGQGSDDWANMQNSPAPYTDVAAMAYKNAHLTVAIESAFNGNLYFTKWNSDQLWVVPTPDNALSVDLDPKSLDFSNAANPNITTVGQSYYMPDQIDWYNYSAPSFTNVSINIGKANNECGCKTVFTSLSNAVDFTDIATMTLTTCTGILSACVPNTGSYNIVTDNGVTISNAVVNGVIQYPAGQNYFDLNADLGHKVHVELRNETPCKCTPIEVVLFEEKNVGGVIVAQQTASFQGLDCHLGIDPCIQDDRSYFLRVYEGGVFKKDIKYVVVNGVVQYQNGLDFIDLSTSGYNNYADCCPILNGEKADNIKYYNKNTTITVDEMWDDKIYIAPYVTVTVSGATLDITNVDVIFDECSGIDFQNGAVLRANNSVFRPCDINGRWIGLRFLQNSPSSAPTPSGMINECTFKNAKKAIEILHNGGVTGMVRNSSLRLTNNLFANCYQGVAIQLGGNISERSISGNTFSRDDNAPSWAGSCYGAEVTVSYGLVAENVVFDDVVGQNDFINNSKIESTFYGMSLGNVSKMNVVDNSFVNNKSAVYASSVSKSQFQNNKISVSASYKGLSHQFQFGASNNIIVSNNDFNNSSTNNTYVSGAEGISAILIHSSSIVNIKGNTINNFETGILCGLTSSSVSENTIVNCWRNGIYLGNPLDVRVACNTINMELNTAIYPIGIHMNFFNPVVPTSTQINTIKGNCIYETKEAIHIEGNGSIATAPIIKNNFLYNYTSFGVNFVGNISLSNFPLGSGSSQTAAGKNTFTSNNIYGGAVDINNTTGNALSSQGNYGVSSVSINVQTLFSNMYNSTASCGGQIGTVNSEITDNEKCDLLTGNEPALGMIAIDTTNKLVKYDATIVVAEGVVNVDQAVFEVYPSPAQSFVNIKMNAATGENLTIAVYSVDGRLMKSLNFSGHNIQTTMDVSELAHGVYTVQLIEGSEVVANQKLVVIK